MVKFNCLDKTNFIKNDSNFYDSALTLGCDNEFILLDQTEKINNNNLLNILSNQNKIIIDYCVVKNIYKEKENFLHNNQFVMFDDFVTGKTVNQILTFNENINFNNYVYEFLHYVFFPIFFLDKTFDNILFVFKEPKNLNKIDTNFLMFLFDFFKNNDINYIMIDKTIETIRINNFLIYNRLDERFKNISKNYDNNNRYNQLNDKIKLTLDIDNGHNYYLPKEIIMDYQLNSVDKIIIPVSTQTKNLNLTEKILYNIYGLSLNDILKYNMEIVCIDDFNNFLDLLDFLKKIKYVIVTEDSDILPYLLFTPIGTTFFMPNNKVLNYFDLTLPKIMHSMFYNSFIWTNNLIKELECMK